MMPKYIDAIRLLIDTIYNPSHVPYIAESDILFAPTADVVERRVGKWVDPAADNVYRCSVCEEYTTLEAPGLFYHYCPNCGAQMDQVVAKDAITTDIDITKMYVNIEETWITSEKRKG